MGIHSIEVNILYLAEFNNAKTWGFKSFKVYLIKFMHSRDKCSLKKKSHNKYSISIQTDKHWTVDRILRERDLRAGRWAENWSGKAGS